MDSYQNDRTWLKVQEYLPPHNRLEKAELPEEYYLTIDTMEIHIDHYKVASPKGRVILFHGVGGNGRMLSALALPLMKNGFEVICPDLPLYGYTRCSKNVTWQTWVSVGTEIVNHYQSTKQLSTFLFGLSAGGMLAYQTATECPQLNGLMASCILDQRDKEVTKHSAKNPYVGMAAKPALALLQRVAGRVRIPMKWIGNMKAIVNNEELAAVLMKDKKSSGARVSLAFIHTMLNPVLKTEPEDFKSCPFLLVHPAEDHWTDLKYSLLFYQRLACEKQTVILEGAGHFPIEEPGLMQLEQACAAFLESHL